MKKVRILWIVFFFSFLFSAHIIVSWLNLKTSFWVVNILLLLTAQEVLESLKDRWFQADNPPADQLLNEQEFLSFLHPEHSKGMLKYMVKEIVRDLGNSQYLRAWVS